uniref:Vomeronasal type-1 receptor n=1 Tax=Chlorocebus sabaeus TaxID=60711 RepID=A0A0D9S5G6_CHLSB
NGCWDVAMGMMFLLQTVLGILGIFSLIYHYLFFSITRCRLRSTDLIIKHLIVANTLFLLPRGVPQTMAAFGFRYFLNDSGCKFLFYVDRVGGGVSIGSTCLLSVFQAITVSPRSRWAELEGKAPKHAGSCVFLSWLLHMLVNSIVLMHVMGKRRSKTTTKTKDLGYCSAAHHQDTRESLHAALLSFPDVICLGLVLWGSSSIVCISTGTSSGSPTSSPESRATKTILLVSTFVSFYTLSTFQVCLGLLNNPMNISAMMNANFPNVSPFILISGDSGVSKLCSAWLS